MNEMASGMPGRQLCASIPSATGPGREDPKMSAIRCPRCQGATKVTRVEKGLDTVRRRRKCLPCDHRFWSVEVIDLNGRPDDRWKHDH